MPEELFDLVEDLFDGASNRRKKSKKSKKKAGKQAQRPIQNAPAPSPRRRAESSSGGLLGRITSMFQPASEPQPAPEADPHADLERAHQQQLRLLDEVRRSVDEVTEARRRMQERADLNTRRSAEHEAQAAAHMRAGREDLARVALERKRLAMAQSGEFERELSALGKEQTQLLRAEARLEAKIEAFEMRRDVLRSQRASAEAQARMSEMYGGVSEESRDVAFTLQRIETHTTDLRSRGAALDQMLDDGLVDGVEDPQTRFDRRLELAEVEDDLERLRRETSAGGTMTVRILGEGQYRLGENLIDALNDLDARLLAFLDAGDEEHFSELLSHMASLVHAQGTALDDAELVRSDAVIPPEDATVEEIRALLGVEGLIPG